MSLPIKHRVIVSEPLLGEIDFSELVDNRVEKIIVGGESGDQARLCDFEWVKKIHSFCMENSISFFFKQTGANFKKGDRVYRIHRKYQFEQAKKANLDFEF